MPQPTHGLSHWLFISCRLLLLEEYFYRSRTSYYLFVMLAPQRRLINKVVSHSSLYGILWLDALDFWLTNHVSWACGLYSLLKTTSSVPAPQFGYLDIFFWHNRFSQHNFNNCHPLSHDRKGIYFTFSRFLSRPFIHLGRASLSSWYPTLSIRWFVDFWYPVIGYQK